jgi:hypothetical protein
MHEFMDIEFSTFLIFFGDIIIWIDYIISNNMIKFSKIYCVQNLSFSVYLRHSVC